MSFGNLGLNKSLLDILEKENYKSPYPIQEQAIPEILKGKDVLGIAQTGSGKTGDREGKSSTTIRRSRYRRKRCPEILRTCEKDEIYQGYRNRTHKKDRQLDK